MIYVYAIADDADPGSPQSGIDGAPVEIVLSEPGVTGGVAPAAAVSRVPALPAATPEAVWQHESVVEALYDRCAVLPMRFGTVLRDRDTVRQLLDDPSHAATLARLRGHVEIAVRVLAVGGAALGSATLREPRQPGRSGRAYLEGLVAARQGAGPADEGERLARRVHAWLGEHATESLWTGRTTERLVLTAAYLVRVDELGAFRVAVEEMSGELPIKLLCTGPWPPYSFVASSARPEPSVA